MLDPAETSELLAFVKTVDTKSVSRAALELGVPRATVSRRLARLEEHLGVRLLQRTTRSLTLTDAGEAFYGNARMALDAVNQAEDSVRRRDDIVRGPLRVSLPPIQDPSFNQLLIDFAKSYPLVQLQLHFSSQYVDLKRDGYHVALRASTALEPGLVARTLVRAPIVCVASPEYVAARGAPQDYTELRQHDLLLGFARGELPQTHWPLSDGGRFAVEGILASNEIGFVAASAAAGLGIALLPVQLIAPYMREGRLVAVLHGVVGAESQVALVYPEREFMPAQVRAFIDVVAAWAPAHLGQDVVKQCLEHGECLNSPS